MSFKLLDVPFEVKEITKTGRLTGYASGFGNVDHQKEIMATGCFDKCLADLKAKGRSIPILLHHDTKSPVGIYDVLEPDAKGLWVEGDLLVEDVQKAREAAALAKAKALTGLSIGHFPEQSTFDQKSGIRTITESTLMEVSLVTFPANDLARVEAIKMKLAHGGMPSMSDFEKFLRDAGFSKSQAAVVANRGLGHLLREAGDNATAPALKSIVDELRAFKLPSI